MTAESTFHARLRETIARKGMTQTELAERLGVRVATVNEWLKRDRFPNGAVMLRLPELLDVDGHWLLTGTRRSAEAEAGKTGVDLESDRVVALLEVAVDLLRNRGQTAPLPAEAQPIGQIRPVSEREAMALSAVRAFQARGRLRRTRGG